MCAKKMQWHKLLSSDRQGKEEHPNEDPRMRNPFERDFDRIIFSESFRRLKDKTQVFPITDNDHVHNRLTHSLEVSCIGRSLGRQIGVDILDKHKNDLNELVSKGLNEASFGTIVQAACLAHDIGNPPFGHSGENAIQAWFYSDTGRQHIIKLKSEEKEDLELFEGNAQGFRIITKAESQTGRKGMQLTYATLATFTKYPRESLIIDYNLDKKNNWRDSAKKFGFFQAEKKIFEEVADKVGLIRLDENLAWWCRHPLAFLVEAADDICYRIMDLEDGFNMGYIDYKTTENLLVDIAGDEYRKKLQNSNDKSCWRENIRYLRGKAINKLMEVAKETFMNHEDELLTGKFDKSLLEADKDIKNKINNIKQQIKSKVYTCHDVLSIEVAGYDVVSGLLNEFIPAVNDGELPITSNKKNKKSDKIRDMLPGKKIFDDQFCSKEYLNILRVTDYISGMTDSYAVSLFKKIKGISLA